MLSPPKIVTFPPESPCIKHDYKVFVAVKIHTVHAPYNKHVWTLRYLRSFKNNTSNGIFPVITPLLLWLQRTVDASVTSVRRFGLCVHVDLLGVICTHSTKNTTKVTVEAQERWGITGKIPILFIPKLHIVSKSNNQLLTLVVTCRYVWYQTHRQVTHTYRKTLA